MSDLQELSQVLADHEQLAPDPAGLVEAARAGAARIRRRRVAYTAVTTAVAVLAVIVVSVVLVKPAPPPDRPPVVANRVVPVKMQITVDLAPDPDLTKLAWGRNGNTQHLSVRVLGMFDNEITVHDPGTYDPAPLTHGEPVTVQGHSAYYIEGLPVTWVRRTALSSPSATTTPVPAVGWRDGSGAWVVIYQKSGPKDRSSLLRLAEAVRLGSPHGLRAPFHLSYLPLGLPAVNAKIIDSGPFQRQAFIGFDPDSRLLDNAYLDYGIPRSVPFGINAIRSTTTWTHMWRTSASQRRSPGWTPGTSRPPHTAGSCHPAGACLPCAPIRA